MYRPVMDYEESVAPHAVFASEYAAKKAVLEIVEWMQDVSEQMQSLGEHSRDERLRVFNDRIPSPYGWAEANTYDLPILADRDHFVPGSVAILELPLL